MEILLVTLYFLELLKWKWCTGIQFFIQSAECNLSYTYIYIYMTICQIITKIYIYMTEPSHKILDSRFSITSRETLIPFHVSLWKIIIQRLKTCLTQHPSVLLLRLLLTGALQKTAKPQSANPICNILVLIYVPTNYICCDKINIKLTKTRAQNNNSNYYYYCYYYHFHKEEKIIIWINNPLTDNVLYYENTWPYTTKKRTFSCNKLKIWTFELNKKRSHSFMASISYRFTCIFVWNKLPLEGTRLWIYCLCFDVCFFFI